MAYCVHHVPGRIRFKVPKLQSDPAYAKELEQKMLALAGVTDVEVNRSAWSMVVRYDVGVNPVNEVMEHITAARNKTNGNDVIRTPLINGHVNGSNGHHNNNGNDMSRVVGRAIGQAIFATVVQRTLDRSLISILTGLR